MKRPLGMLEHEGAFSLRHAVGNCFMIDISRLIMMELDFMESGALAVQTANSAAPLAVRCNEPMQCTSRAPCILWLRRGIDDNLRC